MRLALLAILYSIFGHSAEVAISIDDAPMRNMAMFTGLERTQILIDLFDKYKIQTVIFSNTEKLKKYQGQLRMEMYDRAGHLIANHTHTHSSLYKVSFKAFRDDFDQADVLLRQFKNFRPWFRFPFLRHGDTIKKRDAMREHLEFSKYKHGFVTLDTQDWFMAKLLNDALEAGKKVSKKNLCKAYSDMQWDTMIFYEQKAQELLKRSPKHMLLIHENDLAALCLEALIKKIKREKWKIISPDQAIKDPIYSYKPDTLFNGNGQIAAMYHENFKIKLYEPWSSSDWRNGKLIREEFNRRKVFYSQSP